MRDYVRHRQARHTGLVREAQTLRDAREPATPNEVWPVGQEARANLACRETEGRLAASRKFQRPR